MDESNIFSKEELPHIKKQIYEKLNEGIMRIKHNCKKVSTNSTGKVNKWMKFAKLTLL